MTLFHFFALNQTKRTDDSAIAFAHDFKVRLTASPVVRARRERVLGGRALADEVRVEDVELVALDNFGRWVIDVVVRLVVLVPLEAGVDAVEVPEKEIGLFKDTSFGVPSL